MKMPNITPGPWHAFEGMVYSGEKVVFPNQKRPTYPINTPEKEAICQAHDAAQEKIKSERKWVFAGGCGCCNSWYESSENKADAVAGAAVPDLLEALIMVLDDPQALDGRPRTAEVVKAALLKAGCTHA